MALQVVRNSLADIVRLRERPSDEKLPAPTDEKKPPRKDLPQLSYGANKKYPHLSKAIEVSRIGIENLLHDDKSYGSLNTKCRIIICRTENILNKSAATKHHQQSLSR